MRVATGTIKTKLQLEGEKEYQKALADSYGELRILREELKLETEELGNNATEMDKAAVKSESLKKQIEEQAKIVETLAKAYEQSKVEYADNEELQEKWRLKLIKAQTELAKMNNSLDDLNEYLSGSTGSLDDAADSLGDVEESAKGAATEVVSMGEVFDSVKDIATSIGETISQTFEAIKEAIAKTVQEMLQLVTEAGVAAQNWTQIQGIYGGSIEDIQTLFYGSKSAGIDTGALTASIQKVVEKVSSGSEEVTSLLASWGIDPSVMSDMDLYMAVMTKLNELGDQKTNELFFGAGFEDNKVINAWAKILEHAKTAGDAGVVMDQSQVDGVNDVYEKMLQIQTLWEQIKVGIGAKLSDVLNIDELSQNTLQLLTDIGAYLNADTDEQRKEISIKITSDIEQALSGITEALGNLGGFLSDLGGNLEGSDNKLLQFLGKLMQSLSKFLDWLAANGDTIIAWLDRLLPTIMVNKVVEATTGKGLGEWGGTIFKGAFDVTKAAVLGKKLLEAGVTATKVTATGTTVAAETVATAGTTTAGTGTAVAGGTMSGMFGSLSAAAIPIMAPIMMKQFMDWNDQYVGEAFKTSNDTNGRDQMSGTFLGEQMNLWWDTYRNGGYGSLEEIQMGQQITDALGGDTSWRNELITLDTDIEDLPDSIVQKFEEKLSSGTEKDDPNAVKKNDVSTAAEEIIAGYQRAIQNQKPPVVYINYDPTSPTRGLIP